MQDKTHLELEIENLYREVKGKDEEKTNLLNLKTIELHTLKANQEKKLAEKSAFIQQLQGDVEHLKDSITKNQELILMLQKTKLKDVS